MDQADALGGSGTGGNPNDLSNLGGKRVP
jgi:hypothetical protein